MTDELTPSPAAAPVAEGAGSGTPASPAPGSGAGVTEATGASAAPAAPSEGKPKTQIRPIPGLVPEHTHQDQVEKAGDKKAAPPTPGDAAGKPGETPPAPATEFTFAGKGFKDQAAAEHSYKTLQGMHKSMVSDREQAISVANAWKSRAEQAEAKLAEAAAAPSPAAPKPGNGKPPAADAAGGEKSLEDRFLETIDWRAYHQLQQQDPLAATMWLATEQTKFFAEQYKAELSQRFQPIEERTQAAQALGRMNDMFTEMSEIKLADGWYAYPELRDPSTAEAVGRTWRDFGFDPSLLFKPQGLHMAVLQFRHTRAGGVGAAPAVAAGGGGNAAPSLNAGSPSASDLAAASAVVTGSSLPANRPAEGDPSAAYRASRTSPVKLVAPGVLP